MKKQSGSGLIFAVILLFVILGMVVTLSSITVLETKMSQKSKSSVGAFYNADSGVEWALNKIASSSGTIASSFSGFSVNKVPCPDQMGGANTCEVYFLDSNGLIISNSALDVSEIKAVRSVGTQNIGGAPDTQRAIEAAVAAGGGGCYVDYSLAAGLPIGSSCGAVGGFTIKRSAGSWGTCSAADCGGGTRCIFFRPQGANCNLPAPWVSQDLGEAYVCCM